MLSKTCAYQNEPLRQEERALEVENPMILVMAAMVSGTTETEAYAQVRAFQRYAWTVFLRLTERNP
jgi:hypothetical protein